jgi:hypothetical protein
MIDIADWILTNALVAHHAKGSTISIAVACDFKNKRKEKFPFPR